MRPRKNEFGVYPKKIHGSVIYYYWVYDSNGKRRFRSSGKKDYDDAVKYCRDLQIQGRLISKIPLSFSSYTKDFFVFDKCKYINYRMARGFSYSRPWAARQKRLLDTIIAPYFENKNIRSISFNDIETFLTSLKEKRFSNKKINHIIATLKCIFKILEINNEIGLNPCKEIKYFKVITPEKGILTSKEIKILFSEENRGQLWPEPIHFAINYLAAFTGLRLGEIQALRAQDFNNNTLIVTHSFGYTGLKDTKNGKIRTIPLDLKLNELLTECCKEKKQNEFIFSVNNGAAPMCHKTIYKRFWKALEFLKIDKAERKRRNLSFHSHRHFANSILLQSGMHPEVVRMILGHSSASMTIHYAHLQLPNVIEVFEKSNKNSKNIESQNTIMPKYIKELIDKGMLYPDGKRVVKSLDNVALELQKMSITFTEKSIMEMFRKPDESVYSIKACKKAINYANSA